MSTSHVNVKLLVAGRKAALAMLRATEALERFNLAWRQSQRRSEYDRFDRQPPR